MPRLGGMQIALALGAVAVLIAVGAAHLAVLKPRAKEVASLQSRISQLTQERSSLQGQIAELRALMPPAPHSHSHTHAGEAEAHTHEEPEPTPALVLSGKILAMETELGARAAQFRVMEAVLDEARRIGIREVSFPRRQSGVGQPLTKVFAVARQREGESRREQNVVRAQITLNVVATWRELVMFLAAVEDLDDPVAVNGVEISRAKDGEVRARVTLLAYISQAVR